MREVFWRDLHRHVWCPSEETKVKCFERVEWSRPWTIWESMTNRIWWWKLVDFFVDFFCGCRGDVWCRSSHFETTQEMNWRVKDPVPYSLNNTSQKPVNVHNSSNKRKHQILSHPTIRVYWISSILNIVFNRKHKRLHHFKIRRMNMIDLKKGFLRYENLRKKEIVTWRRVSNSGKFLASRAARYNRDPYWTKIGAYSWVCFCWLSSNPHKF